MTSSRREQKGYSSFFVALIHLRNNQAEQTQQENLHLLNWLRYLWSQARHQRDVCSFPDWLHQEGVFADFFNFQNLPGIMVFQYDSLYVSVTYNRQIAVQILLQELQPFWNTCTTIFDFFIIDNTPVKIIALLFVGSFRGLIEHKTFKKLHVRVYKVARKIS